MNSRKMDTTSVFAITALLVAGLATVAMIAAAFGAFDSERRRSTSCRRR